MIPLKEFQLKTEISVSAIENNSDGSNRKLFNGTKSENLDLNIMVTMISTIV